MHLEDNKLKVAPIMISDFDKIEKVEGKEENAGFQTPFSPWSFNPEIDPVLKL